MNKSKPTAQWRPISTAPKDGTWLLVFNRGSAFFKGKHRGQCVAHFQTTTFETYERIKGNTYQMVPKTTGHWLSRCDSYVNPTHWMPLPPNPTKNRRR